MPGVRKTIIVNILHHDSRWRRRLPKSKTLLEKALKLTFEEVKKGKKTARLELSVVLANDAFIHDLNKTYRHADKATNVLSFPNFPDAIKMISRPSNEGPLELGDVILAYETLAAEAKVQGKRFADHALHLIVHGALHLLGFDHMKPAEAKVMERHEVRILEKLNIRNPYT